MRRASPRGVRVARPKPARTFQRGPAPGRPPGRAGRTPVRGGARHPPLPPGRAAPRRAPRPGPSGSGPGATSGWASSTSSPGSSSPARTPRRSPPAGRRAFFATRLARLYPAYLLAFALAAPFALERWADGRPARVREGGAVAAAALLLVQAWIPPIARLWNAPGWSTSVVLAFYAGFPFVAARLARLLAPRPRARARGRVGALARASAPLARAPSPTAPSRTSRWNEPPWLLALKFHPLARAGEFLAGVALGLLHARGLASDRGAALAAPLALGASLAVLAWGGAPYVLLHNGLLVPLFAVAVLALAHGGGALARALGSRAGARARRRELRALRAAGAALAVGAPARRAPAGPASPAFVLCYAAAAVAISLAVARGLERPAARAPGALGAARALARRAPRPAGRATAAGVGLRRAASGPGTRPLRP